MTKPTSVFGQFGPDARLLLVASTGGHLTQLVRFARATNTMDRAVWVTFDSPQSRTLLAGQRVIWVDYVAPRDWRGTIRAARTIARSLRSPEYSDIAFDGVISTGAALAVAGFWWGNRHGVPCAYIESVSRTQGPSLTGKIVRRLSLADTYTQHQPWSSPSWPLTHSVLHGFKTEVHTEEVDPREPLKVFVTLGTIRPFRFDRLVEQVVDVLAPGDTVVWQLGETNRDDLPGEVHELMGGEEFLDAAQTADVVITHSGVGTILQLFDEGIAPIVVPRERRHGEHVDDHQLQIWRLLKKSGRPLQVRVEHLTRETMVEAAARRTIPYTPTGNTEPIEVSAG